MKFWSFQNLGTLVQIRKDGIYIPDFNNEYYKHNCYRLNSYNYILDLYNKKFNQNNKGLVFGLSEYMGNTINTYEDYKNALKTINGNGFSTSLDETYLLELDIPIEEEYIMPIDFYLFADLLYFCDIDKEEGNDINKYCNNTKLQVCKDNLFNMNTDKDIYELKQVHFPYIKKEYITNIYKAIEYNDIKDCFIESECECLDYFKQVLMN